MKKIVVTGATSMLGVATVEEFFKNSTEVVAIVHRNSKNFYRLPKSPRLTIIEANLDELATIEPNFNDAETFYHFAWAATTHEGRNNVDVQAANIQHTFDAVRLAKKCGCKKFIFAGSQAEYGLCNKPLGRNTPVNPITPYGIAKYSAGKFAEILCNSLDIKFIWARIVSVFGANDGANTLISYLVNCYKNNVQPTLTDCEQIWDYLYADDAARAFRLLGERETYGVYVIGSGVGLPLKSYIEKIYQIMKPNVPLVFGDKPYAQNQVIHLIADISDLQRDTSFKVENSFEIAVEKMLAATPKGGGGGGGGWRNLIAVYVICNLQNFVRRLQRGK